MPAAVPSQTYESQGHCACFASGENRSICASHPIREHAKQTGLAGLGALWGSAGITHLNSNEKLCPQYLLRTDDMDYQIRPLDLKHATILPIGQEGEFKIKKNEMILTMTEGSDKKARSYEVVSMDPANPDSAKSSLGNDR